MYLHGHANKACYYSFKIFLRLWLAKITRIIYHNLLLLTKYERILPYWTDNVKSAGKLHIIEPLTEKTFGRLWVVFEVSNGGTFYSFHGELLSKKHSKNSKTTTRRTTSAIWSIFAGKQCFNLFLNLELFWMNNKAVIEFGFRRIWILQIKAEVDNTHCDLQNSSYSTKA